MTLTEIKKALYKTRPIANFEKIRSGYAYYETTVKHDDGTSSAVVFEIPTGDMGDATFEKEMDAKSMIRWITGHVLLERQEEKLKEL